MFDIQTQLFEGRDIRFGPIDHEKDPEIESRWTHDSDFMRLLEVNPARPMSAALIKKQYEKIEKQIDDDKNFFYFAIRAKEDDRLIGKALIQWVDLIHKEAWVGIGIGDRDFWGKGYGTDIMKLCLQYAFMELNMQRVSLGLHEYNPRALRSYEKAGFRLEGRTRQDLMHEGKRYDSLWMGILRDEWMTMQEKEKVTR